MSTDVVKDLRAMFAAEYSARPAPNESPAAVPAMLNALGACAGFAAQVAVWRTLILPNRRNPGDFLVNFGTRSGETFIFGESTNLFLFGSVPGRLSFLNLVAATLSSITEAPDLAELAGRTAQSLGSESFGRPRVPRSVSLSELPRTALTRTWGKVASILRECRPAEWPLLLGATAQGIIISHRASLRPPIALQILLEAAVPMSKLNPATVEGSGVPAPSATGWSMRAMQPARQQEILNEVAAAMPARPAGPAPKPTVIAQPKIAFVNLIGRDCDAIVAKDSSEIGSLFHGRVEVTAGPVPRCNVLFMYCTVEPSGAVPGQRTTIRDLIGKSGARVAVVAAEVAGETIRHPEFVKSLNRGNNPPVNLVITVNRNGEKYGGFFRSLFQSMWTGVSMPLAWVQLAPQGPRPSPDVPGALCLMEAGQLVFGGDGQGPA